MPMTDTERESLQERPDPQSAEEAMRMRDDLGISIQEIQNQLSNRNRLFDGQRMTGEAYWAWHRSARSALLHKIRQMKDIKTYLRKKLSEPASGAEAGEVHCAANELIKASYAARDVMKKSAKTIEDLVRDNGDLLDTIRDLELQLRHDRAGNPTPGEWRFVENRIEADGLAIATVFEADDFAHVNAQNRDELNAKCWANGLLMAAGPKLLAACKFALARIESDIETDKRKCDEGHWLRAAIAFATTGATP